MISLLHLLFPTYCCYCGKIGRFLCFTCFEKLEFLQTDVKLTLNESYLEQVQAAVHYQHPIDAVLHQLKYQSVFEAGKYCGKLIFETLNLSDVEFVTYIPLHPSKQRVRGFNQAQVIAETLAALLQIPCLPLLIRVRKTQTQAQLTSDEARHQNLIDAFAYNHRYEIKNQRLLLIDDVVTTGNTLNEAARILKRAGAGLIYGVAVAHGQ